MFVTEIDKLKEICKPCKSVEEGEDIAIKLFEKLSDKGI